MKRRFVSAGECIYCRGKASTRDHVPAKLLLERPLPAQLGTVPSCRKCNQGFSLDEQYLLVLLGQIATSKKMSEKSQLGKKISKTLERAPALDERLFQSLEVDEEEGRVLIRPELKRVERVIAKTAIGLYVLKYDALPKTEDVRFAGIYRYNLSESRPIPYFISTFSEKFRRKKWTHVQREVFSYIFVRDPRTSRQMWCILDFYQCLWGIVHLPSPTHKRSSLPAKYEEKGQQLLKFTEPS